MALTQAEVDALAAVIGAGEDLLAAVQALHGELKRVDGAITWPEIVDSYTVLKQEFGPSANQAKDAVDAAKTAFDTAWGNLP